MCKEAEKELVVLVTHGIDSELSSVALVLACGGITSGQKVSLFLTSAGVDLVRNRGIDMTHVAPVDPLTQLMDDFRSRGGEIWACPPCVTSRGYTQDDFIEGVEIVGASKMHEAIKRGAGTICL